jgi:hypothetical protein
MLDYMLWLYVLFVVETNKPSHINMPPYNKTSKISPKKKVLKIIQSLELRL